MLERDARPEEAAEVLERALYIDPLDRQLQETLAGLWQKLDVPEREVQARAAVVALDPPDRAGALYRLAEAELRAGDRTAARRSVLRALELAPGYDEAQALLLRLVEESSS
jgi:tetratricopeptide (TPR) repeat protein